MKDSNEVPILHIELTGATPEQAIMVGMVLSQAIGAVGGMMGADTTDWAIVGDVGVPTAHKEAGEQLADEIGEFLKTQT